ncbi:MAG: hypothetical protein RJB04_1830 [Verrucomicrobiota bacterium]
MAEPINHDSPWKETLNRFLRPFLELTFPSITQHIDWSVTPISLEQEFREIAPDAELGPLRADKLIKVRLLNGTDQWLLIHIEVQMQYDPKLPRRVFDYCCRIHSRYRIPVVPLVILGDTRRNWRPTTYSGGFGNLGLRIRFAICKVGDFKNRIEAPRHRDNLTIFIIAAYLGTQKHRKDPANLSECRLELTQKLYARGYTQEDLRSLLFVIDWLMPLPAEHKVQFRKRLQQLQKENPMPHVTLFEELSREEGRQEGRQGCILDLLETRFGEVPVAIRDRVQALYDEARLKEMLRRAAVIPSLEEF